VSFAGSLHRLLHIRELEKDRLRSALEAAQAELRHLDEVRRVTTDRERRGRTMIVDSILTGNPGDRLAGVQETRMAMALERNLDARIESVAKHADALRASYMTKQLERLQLETLIEAARSEAEQQTARRTQEALDDAHRSRTRRGVSASAVPQPNRQF
jgi:flagellar biosynthesis chaperone FliJ